MKAGRPKVGLGSTTVTASISIELLAYLDNLAYDLDRTRAEVMNTILEEWFQKTQDQQAKFDLRFNR